MRRIPPFCLVLVVGGCAGALAACRHRALEVPRPEGGYLLTTTVGTFEQAWIRIQRSARHYCGSNYVLTPTPPEVVREDRVPGFLGGSGNVITVQTVLTCERR
jgi:hypothetical protein